jgi:putative transposase
MLRLHLTSDQRKIVCALRRDATLQPVERDRVEMLLLAAEGWSPPRVAHYLGCHPATVRQVIKRFAAVGTAAVPRRRPGPPPNFGRRQQVTTALQRLLDQPRTWTAAQLAAALRQDGIALSSRQTRKYLKLLDARWQRTATTLKHKQNPERAAQAGRILAHLKKSPRQERCGSPTWTSVGSAPVSP